jgi:hypothetical protein
MPAAASTGVVAPAQAWERVKGDAQASAALWAIVSKLVVGSMEGLRVTLLAPPALLAMATKFAAPKLMELFARHGAAGVSVLVHPDPSALADAEPPTAPVAAQPAPAPAVETFAPGEHPAEHPLVKRVQQVLGARVVGVRKRSQGNQPGA